MKISELREVCQHWREKLGLTEWTIELRFVKPSDKIGKEWEGHAYWEPEFPKGEILVQRNAQANTIVHELLHIRLEGHRPHPKRYDALYERAINCLAEALLAEELNPQ